MRAFGASGVREAAVIARDRSAGVSIVAYVAPNSPAPTPDALRRHLAGTLPAYMLPSSFVMIDAIPRNSGGKVDKRRLLEQETGERAFHALPGAADGHREPHGRFVAGNSEPTLCRRARRFLSGRRKYRCLRPVWPSGSDNSLASTCRSRAWLRVPRSKPWPRLWTLRSRRPAICQGQVVLLRSGGATKPPLSSPPRPAAAQLATWVRAAAFQHDRTVYGLVSPGLSGGKAAVTITGQARDLLEGIYAVQPTGPYCIAGWSLGGPVAFEIACLLREDGRQLSFSGSSMRHCRRMAACPAIFRWLAACGGPSRIHLPNACHGITPHFVYWRVL